MSKVIKAVWQFFASVKLALISLFILAAVSIIGTLVKQKEAASYYVQEYGPNLARFLDVLDITNMYTSWWFVTLLCLFAVNLIVCSIKRLPNVWRLVVLDNLTIDYRQLEKMSFTHRSDIRLPAEAVVERLQQCVARAGWKKSRRLDREGTSLLFIQKGAWTRLSVYVVHLSILVIFAGAMIGMFFGFQAYVFLPEGRSTNTVFLQGTTDPVSLGYDLRFDRMELDYYPNGMVKQSRVDLTVIDSDRQTSYRKSTIVNDPLTYRGLTFYQADSFPLDEFFVQIRNSTTGMEQSFRVPPARDVDWPGTNASFRIEETVKNQDDAVERAKINFAANKDVESTVFWIGDKGNVTIRQLKEEYFFTFRQLSTVLLLVTKDPGIWIVYSGCTLMLVGLAFSFLLIHQRIWVYITRGDELQTRILVSGISNKRKPVFEKRFNDLVGRIEHELRISEEEKR